MLSISSHALGGTDSLLKITALPTVLESCLPFLKIAALVALVATAAWKIYNYFYPSAEVVAALPNWDSNFPSDCCRQIDAAIAANGGYGKWRTEAKNSFENQYYPISDEHDDVRAYYVLEKALESEDKELAFRHLKHAYKHFRVVNTELLARIGYHYSAKESFWNLLLGR